MASSKHHTPLVSGAQFLAILMLVIAFFEMPSNYYSFLRCVVVIACMATIYDARNWRVSPRFRWFAISGFVLLVLLFNPVILCTFYRTTWGFIDLAAIASLFWVFSVKREETDNGQIS